MAKKKRLSNRACLLALLAAHRVNIRVTEGCTNMALVAQSDREYREAYREVWRRMRGSQGKKWVRCSGCDSRDNLCPHRVKHEHGTANYDGAIVSRCDCGDITVRPVCNCRPV